MHYSPIIAPVFALAVWSMLVWLTSIPLALVLWADDVDLPLAEEKRERYADLLFWRQNYIQAQPLPFYVLCLALAHIGADNVLAAGLGWAFAVTWVMGGFSLSKHLRCGSAFVGFNSLYALAIYAGIRVTRDLLAAYG